MGAASASHSFEAERELLYQILFDLRREVADLKRYVHEHQATQSVEHYTQTSATSAREGVLYSNNASVELSRPNVNNLPYWEAEEVKDVEPPIATEMVESEEGKNEKMPKSLDDLERDMIRRALEANNGRRKVAAEKLGISERTLYRKIKEYGLE